ncbi:MAG TPA: ABC transporter permease, partial [Flavisolibacter sp.]
MISNYFKIALRHLKKNKLYAFVNIAGLAIGITSCLLIGIYIFEELSYDRFHAKADRIARVTWQYNFGDAETKTASTGTKVGPQFQRTFPEVEGYVRLMKYPRVLKYEDKVFEEKNFLYGDSAFFSMFSFPLLKGNPATALDAPEKLVMTQSMAGKYFGDSDPIGKTVNVGGTKNFIVTGIVADAPENSQIQFDFIGSFKTLNASKTEKWNEANYITYLLLKQEGQLASLQQKVSAYAKKVAKEEMQVEGNNYMTFLLEPFTKVHLHSKLDGLEPNNSIVYIYILAAVALLILLVAGVNYTNLSTAQSAGRSAEIGMRKVMGARKWQVFNQFICESFVLTLFATVLALGIAALLLPYFNELAGKDLGMNILFSPLTLGCLLILAVVVTFLAGAYPALILSNSKIIQILKSGFRFTGSGGLRKSLIVFQFVISIFLIVSTIIILQQLSYIKNKELGYNKEQVVVLPLDAKVLDQYEDFKQALAKNPGVVSVGGAYESPTDIGWGDGLTSESDGKRISINALPADETIVKTLQLQIIAGTDYTWTDVQQFDTSDEGKNIRYQFMLNESAVKAFGWTPQEAVGKKVSKGKQGVVKAVVKDFHFRSFHEEIKPLAIFLDRRMLGSLFVKVADNNLQSTLSSLEKTWKERVPHRPFEYSFLDEEYNAL